MTLHNLTFDHETIFQTLMFFMLNSPNLRLDSPEKRGTQFLVSPGEASDFRSAITSRGPPPPPPHPSAQKNWLPSPSIIGTSPWAGRTAGGVLRILRHGASPAMARVETRRRWRIALCRVVSRRV